VPQQPKGPKIKAKGLNIKAKRPKNQHPPEPQKIKAKGQNIRPKGTKNKRPDLKAGEKSHQRWQKRWEMPTAVPQGHGRWQLPRKRPKEPQASQDARGRYPGPINRDIPCQEIPEPLNGVYLRRLAKGQSPPDEGSRSLIAMH